MNVQLRPVTIANRGYLEDIEPGEPQRYWVHSNWYWHQQSLDNPNITFRMVHVASEEAPVGMVAYGPMYLDEALTRRVSGAYEITHLVLDVKYQRRGLGAIVCNAVLAALLELPDCQRVVVAVHPDNNASAAFFLSLSFAPTELRNYDQDLILEYRGQREA